MIKFILALFRGIRLRWRAHQEYNAQKAHLSERLMTLFLEVEAEFTLNAPVHERSARSFELEPVKSRTHTAVTDLMNGIAPRRVFWAILVLMQFTTNPEIVADLQTLEFEIGSALNLGNLEPTVEGPFRWICSRIGIRGVPPLVH